ncbi:ISL3 family transposase [Streptomyces sp. SP17BM10]|uniref:ISL3 family transposase n=1 Tax=Streptomyces sp. SP17BM10 TaxID=3002530 RepID=UPI002E75DC4C|nr:ISL3 family transposase [Streptomyces sp. SP17BM10]MEE1782394.1 ISL3 family transposase [Streptomyces sp. SP17BM10]
MSQSWSWFGELLFPSLPQVEVAGVEASGAVVRIAARVAAPGASCPDCGAWSERAHGSYLRYPSDLPSCGQPVTVALRVRRFACPDPVCRRRTFVEQVDGLTRRHGQVTERQRSSVAGLGLALAGRAGARMAALLGIRASRSTLLRRVMELPDPAVGAPVAVGVDDFALRKGHTYGTVITNAVTHEVLDLLPERDAATLAPWLAGHPQIEVIARDRASAYAEAADRAAPQARQVADRYHLWANLVRAVERVVTDHRACLRVPESEPEPEPQWETPLPAEAGSADAGAADPAGRVAERRRANYALAHGLLAGGMSQRAVAKHLGWSRNTVRRYAQAVRWQDMMKGPQAPRTVKLDPYKPYMLRRWEETSGRISGMALLGEITARGYRGGYTQLAEWKQRELLPDGPPPPRPPTVREATDWLTRHPDGLTADDALRRKALLAHCPELDTTAHLVTTFAEMLTLLDGDRLPEWITEAKAAGLPGISTFANGLNSDYAAVHAGLTTHWNSGHVEGAVNRIKMLKRQMFGRASFPLLRKRVLLA